MANTNVLGANIRERRQNEDLSPKEAAELLGVTPQYLGQVELGRKRPSDTLMVKICDMLNCSTDDLLKAEEISAIVEDTVKKEVEKAEKPGRNAEGYPDPTAYNAIKNKEGKIVALNWVYEFENSKGYIEDFLVIGCYGNSVTGYNVMDSNSPYITDQCVRYVYRGNYYYIVPEAIMTRPVKHLGNPLYTLEEPTLNKIRKALAKHLSIVSIVDTKIVEKRVEVPSGNAEVEKQLRRTVEDLTIELNNLKAQHQLEMLKLENNILREAMGLLKKSN